MLSFLRTFAYKTLTNRAFAINVLLCELIAAISLGFCVYFLEQAKSLLALPVMLAFFALTFWLVIDILITAFVVFTGRAK